MATGKGLRETPGIARVGKQAWDDAMARNFTFFDVLVAIFIFIHPSMKFTALVDSGIMMQFLMLSAKDRGLGTCPQGSLGMWRSPIKEHFDISKGYKLVCGLALGYLKEDEKVNQYRPRKTES
jgi:nitroreductase